MIGHDTPSNGNVRTSYLHKFNYQITLRNNSKKFNSTKNEPQNVISEKGTISSSHCENKNNSLLSKNNKHPSEKILSISEKIDNKASDINSSSEKFNSEKNK